MATSQWIFVAEADGEGIVTVIILVLGGLYWLFRKLAEARDQSRPAPPAKPEDGGAYVADEQEVQRFIESLSGRPRRPEPRPQPPPQQPGHPPGRPPARPQPVGIAPAPLEPPPPPQRRTVTQKPAPPAPEEYHFAADTTPVAPRPQMRERPAPQPPTPRSPAPDAGSIDERLGFPRLSPLQRAVVLSEVLQRKRGPHTRVRA